MSVSQMGKKHACLELSSLSHCEADCKLIISLHNTSLRQSLVFPHTHASRWTYEDEYDVEMK